MISRWIGTAALLLALAVMAGAFGAHALRQKLDAYYMGVYEKAVFYHFVHSLGIFLVALLVPAGLLESAQQNRICLLLLAGTLIFSGSLYLLALTGARWLGAITPLGGVSFIAGWLLLAFQTFRR